MPKQKVKATKLSVGLPFNLGSLEFVEDETQQKAAWELYVEMVTRIAIQPLDQNTGILREALASLYSIFGVTRDILKKAGPGVAQGPHSFGPVAIEVLNKGLRPFTAKWHPLLSAHEGKRPAGVGARDHEQTWEHNEQFRQELSKLQAGLLMYAEALAVISGAKVN